jgi:cytochrome c oxidase cbb3-type subunit III
MSATNPRIDPQFEDRPLAHDYDGIDEYDNPAPFWLTRIFYATIAFAIGYGVYYHAGGPGQSATEEFQASWTAYAEKRAAAKAGERVVVSDELLTQYTHSETTLGRGKEVFVKNCTSCHTDNGRGLVGPNLTDEYQIHGVSQLDLYQTIRDGVPAKGMLAWGEILPYDDLLAVTAHVITLRGTNAPDGKPPEGSRIAAK